MKLTARAIVPHGDDIFLCQNAGHERPFWCLPGGHLEEGETLGRCVKRELFEEFGIVPDVGDLLAIYESVQENEHFLEFYLHIQNGQDFRCIDPQKAARGDEIAAYAFFNHKTIGGMDLLPPVLKAFIPDIFARNFDMGIQYLSMHL